MCLGLVHGRAHGIIASTFALDRPNLTKLLCNYAQKGVPGFKFTSIQVRRAPSWPRSWTNFSLLLSCIPTGMHEQACIFWANLTALSLQVNKNYQSAMHCDAQNLGPRSPRRSSHCRTALYISVGILYRKYTGGRENDATAYG